MLETQDLQFRLSRIELSPFVESGIEAQFVYDTLTKLACAMRPVLAWPRNKILGRVDHINNDDDHVLADVITRTATLGKLRNAPFHVEAVHTEYDGGWRILNSKKPENKKIRLVTLDELDESSILKKPEINENHAFCQTTGMVVTDLSGNFISGGIVSHVDKRILIVDKSSGIPHVIFGNFDEKTKTFQARDYDLGAYRQPVKIATLKKRFDDPKLNKILKIDQPDFDTFGGFAVLDILSGGKTGDQQIVAADPLKGQPWYEAVLWGWIASEAGLAVWSSRDFQKILLNTYHNQNAVQDRVKLLIGPNQKSISGILNNMKSIGVISEGSGYQYN